MNALFLQRPGFLQGANEGGRVAGVLHDAGIGHFFTVSGKGGLQKAAIEVKDACVDAELVFFAAVAAEAAQAENLGIRVSVEAFLSFATADGEVAREHGTEAVVECGIAVFDVAKFVGEDRLQFVAREVVQRVPADSEGQTVVDATEGEGIDAVIITQDVGGRSGDACGEAEFGNKVGVAVFQRVVIGVGRAGTEGFGLFTRALLLKLVHFAVISRHRARHTEGRKDETENKRQDEDGSDAVSGVRVVVHNPANDEGKKRQKDEEIAEISKAPPSQKAKCRRRLAAAARRCLSLKRVLMMTSQHGGYDNYSGMWLL